LVPQLADDGLYLASESTLYRVQRRYGLRGRRRTTSRTQVTRATEVHRATRPNQVWSWDITLLPTVVRGIWLYLYLIQRLKTEKSGASAVTDTPHALSDPYSAA
jgi:putative transposase